MSAKDARRAFGPVQQRPHVRNLSEHRERMVDRGGIGSRLDVQTDRGSADDEKDSEADSENDTLRRHCHLLFHYFERRAEAVGLVMHSLTTVNSASGVNGLRRQHAAPSSMVIRRKSGARSALAKA